MLQKYRSRQTLLCALGAQLRIGEGDPYLVNLALGKERSDKLDAGAQKSHIAHLSLGCSLCTSPYTGTFDIDADKVLVGVTLGKCYGIFALAATKFENYRVVVVEEISAPITFEGVVGAEHLLECGLHETLKSEVFGKFLQFIFSHFSILSL